MSLGSLPPGDPEPNGTHDDTAERTSTGNGQARRGGPLGWWRSRSEWEKLGIFALIFLVFLGGRWVLGDDAPETTPGNETQAVAEVPDNVETTEPIPLERYEAEAVEVPFDTLNGTPESYEGTMLKVTGRVLDVETGQGISVIRLATVEAGDSYDEDKFMVAGYAGPDELREGDVITAFGDGLGGFEYDYGDGLETVPSMLIKYLAE